MTRPYLCVSLLAQAQANTSIGIAVFGMGGGLDPPLVPGHQSQFVTGAQVVRVSNWLGACQRRGTLSEMTSPIMKNHAAP